MVQPLAGSRRAENLEAKDEGRQHRNVKTVTDLPIQNPVIAEEPEIKIHGKL